MSGTVHTAPMRFSTFGLSFLSPLRGRLNTPRNEPCGLADRPGARGPEGESASARARSRPDAPAPRQSVPRATSHKGATDAASAYRRSAHAANMVVPDPSQGELRETTVDDTALREASRAVYQRARSFHGTDETSVSRLRKEGFKTGLKTAGGAAAAETSPEHFLSDSIRTARLYGRARAIFTGGKAKIARTLGVPDLAHVDRQQHGDVAWYTTEEDIGCEHVLPSKNDPIEDATAQLFQALLEQEGHHVALDVARRELEAVQSDSDDDFRSSADDTSRP